MTALPIAMAPDAVAQPAASTANALLDVYRRAPVEFVRGSGVVLYDASGRAYLDFTSGIAVNALGYGDQGIAAAMQSAMATGVVHVSNLYESSSARRLAEALAHHAKLARVFFCNSGAEACEGAFKFARRWARTVGGKEKHEIIALRGSFHGRLFGSLAATDRPAYRAPFEPLAGGIRIVERDLGELAAVLDASVAALIVEPVQGEGGVRVLEPELLQRLRVLTAERDVALVMDEIQCGLGRTGHVFAHEQAGIIPDIVVVAKPLAGGLPMGAVIVADHIARAVQPGDHGSTFGGGPFIASIALHVVERLADPTLLTKVRANGAWLGRALNDLAARVDVCRAVRGVGFMWGIDTKLPAAAIVSKALELGLLICTAGEHTVRLLPPLIATRDDLARGVALLEAALT